MLQAAVLDGVAFDPFSFHQDGLPAPEVDIGRREVFQALVIALVVVVIDEPADAGFEIARQVIVFQQDAVLQGLMPALDLALGLRMIGRATNMRHILLVEPFCQFAGDVAGPLSLSSRGLWTTRALSQPVEVKANSSVFVTSSVFIVVHSFQAMM